MSPTATKDDTADAAETAKAPASDDKREAILAGLTGQLGDSIVSSHLKPGDDLWIRVDTEAWAETARVLRHPLNCGYFDFVSAIDWMPSPYGREMDSEVDKIAAATAGETIEQADPEPITHGYCGGETRFQVFARVLNVVEKWGVHIKADVPDSLVMDTWIEQYPGANWHEREVHEMFGISFNGHGDMRNLYLPGDFEGHPLRKDFPLLARRVKPWPGIVDVETMPDGDDDEETGE
ncbi:MAG: NADH-quinone oxidoreductase subunit C [Acidimicrobiales bacterium]